MARNPDDIPPAFRGAVPKAASFIGLDDAQVLRAAEHAFHVAQALPLGSPARATEWARFDDAMAELAARGLRHILARLRDQGNL